MRIFGVDPGLQCTGYGIIDVNAGALQYVASGVVRTQAASPLPTRLHTIFSGLVELVEHYRPQIAVVEIVFVNVNPQSTLLLGQARGAALTALTHQQLSVEEYTALQIKQSVVGYGRASKAQMQAMTQRLLHLDQAPSTDAADALGAAITHAHSMGMQQQLSHGLGSLADGIASFRGRRRRGGRSR